MRTLVAASLVALLVGSPTGLSGQVDPDTLDLNAIYNAADSIAGIPVVDTLPNLLNCPRFDPSDVRGDATTFSFERRPEQDIRMGPLEVTLEFVVGKDGRIERRMIRIIRTNNDIFNRQLEYWVRRCAFTPGKIGEHTVRVRMQQTWTHNMIR